MSTLAEAPAESTAVTSTASSESTEAPVVPAESEAGADPTAAPSTATEEPVATATEAAPQTPTAAATPTPTESPAAETVTPTAVPATETAIATSEAPPVETAVVTPAQDEAESANPAPADGKAAPSLNNSTAFPAHASSDVRMNYTQDSVTVATAMTATVTCAISRNAGAPWTIAAVNGITVSTPGGWTITQDPSSGWVIGSLPFVFTLRLTPECGAAVNPKGPNVLVSSKLSSIWGSFNGPTVSITAKHNVKSSLSTSITGSSLEWSRTYSFSPQSVTGSVTYQVAASGCAGWHIQVSATALNYAGKAAGSPIANSSISITPGVPTALSGSTSNVSPGTPGSLGAPVKVLSAGANNGDGTYSQTLGIGITIPGAARVGTYTSTITIAATSGP